MSKSLQRKETSLRALELFQMVAQRGSLKAVADETGSSLSTVSHHLKGLEESLGVELLNHARRPLTLTPVGQTFLDNIENALLAIRKAKAEATSGDATVARLLRIGAIEDFDSDIMPDLAVFLAARMPRCDLTFHTDTSLRVIAALRTREIDLGIATCPSEKPQDLLEIPLLKDPFVLLVPPSHADRINEIFDGQTDLPFIRFPSTQLIAKQIDAQLRRVGRSFPRRFETGNSQTQMAMVAAGAGWSITTPLLYARGRRFHDRVHMAAFPGKAFSRRLAIYVTPDCTPSIRDLVNLKMRSLIEQAALQDVHRDFPWIKGSFHLL